MNYRIVKWLTILLILTPICSPAVAGTELEEKIEQVRATEAAFAQTMADRDFEAFKTFLAEEAVFIAGEAARGKAAVAKRWSLYFEGEEAPFAWEPDRVEVLESGSLALSTGPVFNKEGERTATFTSTWRLEEDGAWRVIFDKGDRYCPSDED